VYGQWALQGSASGVDGGGPFPNTWSVFTADEH